MSAFFVTVIRTSLSGYALVRLRRHRHLGLAAAYVVHGIRGDGQSIGPGLALGGIWFQDSSFRFQRLWRKFQDSSFRVQVTLGTWNFELGTCKAARRLVSRFRFQVSIAFLKLGS